MPRHVNTNVGRKGCSGPSRLDVKRTGGSLFAGMENCIPRKADRRTRLAAFAYLILIPKLLLSSMKRHHRSSARHKTTRPWWLHSNAFSDLSRRTASVLPTPTRATTGERRRFGSASNRVSQTIANIPATLPAVVDRSPYQMPDGPRDWHEDRPIWPPPGPGTTSCTPPRSSRYRER